MNPALGCRAGAPTSIVVASEPPGASLGDCARGAAANAAARRRRPCGATTIVRAGSSGTPFNKPPPSTRQSPWSPGSHAAEMPCISSEVKNSSSSPSPPTAPRMTTPRTSLATCPLALLSALVRQSRRQRCRELLVAPEEFTKHFCIRRNRLQSVSCQHRLVEVLVRPRKVCGHR